VLLFKVISKFKEFEVEAAVNLRMITGFWPTMYRQDKRKHSEETMVQPGLKLATSAIPVI
jgi:hypothetical protein